MATALKSRAKLTRSLPRPGKRGLQYLFKDHQCRRRQNAGLNSRRRYAAGADQAIFVKLII